jgi:IMP dehydrogenase/GMP reductase
MPDPADTNAALFSPTEGLTFDDVVVIPGWSTTLPD